jgi:hypothetical protein
MCTVVVYLGPCGTVFIEDRSLSLGKEEEVSADFLFYSNNNKVKLPFEPNNATVVAPILDINVGKLSTF